MAEETTEKTPAPKKATRKPDPITQLLNEVRTELKQVGEWKTTDTRRRQHDTRAAAWGREYAKTGELDALLLSLTFEALACYPQEQRYSLVQLAAAALSAAEKLEAGK
ncbi:hypothetical protein SEA_ISSMI_42 [Streptomyces phage Issmi]|uniref:Uncharacterized protein n=1 Tax=Streptomyces phage Issmi TaxID=2725628 RepID=A0A6M3SZY1_9CAUD|nr:hypothetical protein KGG87_gp42 [Streptomyces phage Issmi]QJD50688.1 hypothetical protein SEA_ISSMI_42 [Streptomyces phage Issmi]